MINYTHVAPEHQHHLERFINRNGGAAAIRRRIAKSPRGTYDDFNDMLETSASKIGISPYSLIAALEQKMNQMEDEAKKEKELLHKSKVSTTTTRGVNEFIARSEGLNVALDRARTPGGPSMNREQIKALERNLEGAVYDARNITASLVQSREPAARLDPIQRVQPAPQPAPAAPAGEPLVDRVKPMNREQIQSLERSISE